MWEQRGHSDRMELLTLDIETLRQQARQHTEKTQLTAGEYGAAVFLLAAVGNICIDDSSAVGNCF